MKNIIINFQEADIKILTALIGNLTHVTNLDKVINKGLSKQEWAFLCKILELDIVHVPDHQGELTTADTKALKEKICLSVDNN